MEPLTSLVTEWDGVTVKLSTRFLEVLGSNLGEITGYPFRQRKQVLLPSKFYPITNNPNI
jgi:hypothetical protein